MRRLAMLGWSRNSFPAAEAARSATAPTESLFYAEALITLFYVTGPPRAGVWLRVPLLSGDGTEVLTWMEVCSDAQNRDARQPRTKVSMLGAHRCVDGLREEHAPGGLRML